MPGPVDGRQAPDALRVALDDSYSNETLGHMLRVLAQAPPKGTKKERVDALVTLLGQREVVQAAWGRLDDTARAVLARIDQAGGSISWTAAALALTSEGLVEAPPAPERYRLMEADRRQADPETAGSRVAQDVLARLERHGFLVGRRRPGNYQVAPGMSDHFEIPALVRRQLPHLKPALNEVMPQPTAADPSALPAGVVSVQPGDAGRWSRELYLVWSYVWRHRPSLLQTTGLIGKRDLKALAGELPFAVDPGQDERANRHLHRLRCWIQDLGLTRSAGAMEVDLPAAKRFFKLSLADRLRKGLVALQRSERYLELWSLGQVSYHVPRSVSDRMPEVVLAARAAIVAQLQASAKAEAWLTLSELERQLLLGDRDFLVRHGSPRGYYYNAYSSGRLDRYDGARNTAGLHFEGVRSDLDGWTKVEVPFIRLVIGQLHALGLVDLGLDGSGQPLALRLNPWGRQVLAGAKGPAEPADLGRVLVQPNLRIVAFGPVPQLALLAIEQCADRVGTDQALEFELSRDSLYRAQQAGISAATVISQLVELSGGPLPQNVQRSLEAWQAQHEQVVIHRHVAVIYATRPADLQPLVDADGGKTLQPLSATLARIGDKAGLETLLTRIGLTPVAYSGQTAAKRRPLTLDDAAWVRSGLKTLPLEIQGQLQRLADWDAGAEAWHLTAGAVQRATRELGLDAAGQLASWRTLLASEPPWLEARLRGWSGAYKPAKLHPVDRLVELPDATALEALLADPAAASLMREVKAKGPLVTVERAKLADFKACLAELGIHLGPDPAGEGGG